MRLFRVFSLVLASLLLMAWPAQAHTSLVSVDPADGTAVESAPEQIVLTFTENLREPSEASLVVDGAPRGASVEVDGPRLVVTPSEDSEGPHEVHYRVVSADGHPVTGTTSFTVGTAGDGTGDGTDTNADEPADAEADDGSVWTSPLVLGGLVVILALVGFAVLRGRGSKHDRS